MGTPKLRAKLPLLLLLLSLLAADGARKVWLKNTNWMNSANWKRGSLPCSKQVVSFEEKSYHRLGSVQSLYSKLPWTIRARASDDPEPYAVFVEHDVSVLPMNGEIVFADDLKVNFGSFFHEPTCMAGVKFYPGPADNQMPSQNRQNTVRYSSVCRQSTGTNLLRHRPEKQNKGDVYFVRPDHVITAKVFTLLDACQFVTMPKAKRTGVSDPTGVTTRHRQSICRVSTGDQSMTMAKYVSAGHRVPAGQPRDTCRPMPARLLLNPAGASRGYIPDGHRQNRFVGGEPEDWLNPHNWRVEDDLSVVPPMSSDDAAVSTSAADGSDGFPLLQAEVVPCTHDTVVFPESQGPLKRIELNFLYLYL
ncbi:hypothetical protein Bbelb_279240 [Branchiostoma belcheri]|nr:hypothetical protein Bbelb_279240 [Branchiostoma belcheri]